MSRVTSIVWPAFLGVLLLAAATGCRVHVHGKHHCHLGHPSCRYHHPARTKTKVIHHHSRKTVVHQHGSAQSGTVEYDVSDDARTPPADEGNSVTITVQKTPAAPPPPATNGGVPPGLAKKNPAGVPPGQAKKHDGHVPPGQAKKKKKRK